MLNNEYLVEKIGSDTAENEPYKVWKQRVWKQLRPPEPWSWGLGPLSFGSAPGGMNGETLRTRRRFSDRTGRRVQVLGALQTLLLESFGARCCFFFEADDVSSGRTGRIAAVRNVLLRDCFH